MQTMIKFWNIEKWLLLAVFVGACQSKEVSLEAQKKEEVITAIKVSAKQMQTMGIRLGKIEKKKVEEFVLANGTIEAPPESKAIVTAKMEGFVKKCDLLIGDYVKQGQVLTILETPRLLVLQEEFLNTKNQIVFLEQEFQRQSRLDAEEAGLKKNLQKTTNDLQSAKIRLASLEKQLQFVGINTNSLQIGNMSASFAVVSPISGYIRSVNIATGQKVLAETSLFEIVSKEHLHIELQVFEKDVAKIRKGQKVYFQSPHLGDKTFEGEVFLIGQAFDMQSKTINVHVHFEEKETPFLPGMYISARIAIGENEAIAVSEGAVVDEGEESFLFYTTDKTQFYQVPIKVHRREGTWVVFELLKAIPESAWIVEQGAMYLQAATQGQEEE
jgi:cobalt-zinc-cadmium efflux system membrane fusion protein